MMKKKHVRIRIVKAPGVEDRHGLVKGLEIDAVRGELLFGAKVWYVKSPETKQRIGILQDEAHEI